jgi:hypothetical protein
MPRWMVYQVAYVRIADLLVDNVSKLGTFLGEAVPIWLRVWVDRRAADGALEINC